MSSKQQKQQCDPKTTDCIEKEKMVRESIKKPITQVVGSAGMQYPPMTRPSWRGGRKKRRRKSRKKKRKSRRKTRKKRRRKSRKKRKTRRRKKGGVKTSAFKKTLKKSSRVLDLQKFQKQPKHAKLNIVRGLKQPKSSSLSKVTFRTVSPQSQPSLRQQPSQGSVVHQPQPSLADQMAAVQIDSDSSGGEEVATIMNQNP